MTKKKKSVKKETNRLPAIIKPDISPCIQAKGDMGACFEQVGLDKGTVASMLLDLCNWKSIKLDKNGQVTEYIDGALRLKALDLWARIVLPKTKPTKEEHQHVHITEEKLNDLVSKAQTITGESKD